MKEGTNNHGFGLPKPINLPLISKSKEEDEAYLKSLPSGYRFKPQDVELIGYYLKRKVYNQPLPPNRIRDVQLYNYDPETLTGFYFRPSFSLVFFFLGVFFFFVFLESEKCRCFLEGKKKIERETNV